MREDKKKKATTINYLQMAFVKRFIRVKLFHFSGDLPCDVSSTVTEAIFAVGLDVFLQMVCKFFHVSRSYGFISFLKPLLDIALRLLLVRIGKVSCLRN